MDSLLLVFFCTIALAMVLNIFFTKYKISHILGYILTGTIITYVFNLGELAHSHSLEVLAEFGIVFLMFTIGLEITFERLKEMKNALMIDGLSQVAITSLIIYAISFFIFGLDSTSSIIISLAFSLSSTAIVLTFLKQSKEIYAPYGQKSTAILIFQDLAVIPILLLIGFLANSSSSVGEILIETLISAIVVIALLLTIGRKVVAWLLHFAADSRLEELFIGSVLAIVIGASILAHFMGFTYSLGAFLAGMIIAETKYHHKVEADIAPFKDLLLGTFFFSVGMKINIVYFLQNIHYIVALFIGVLFIKGLVIFSILRVKSDKTTSLKSAIVLSEVGEFAFAVFALASSDNLISNELAQFLVLIVVMSMIITPFIVNNINQISAKVIKEKILINTQIEKIKYKNHVVVCGYGVLGEFCVAELKRKDLKYVIITNNLKQVQDAIQKGVKDIYFGNISKPTVLEALNVSEASAVLITLENEDKKRLLCEAILKHNPYTNLVVKINNKDEREDLKDLPIHSFVDGKKEIAQILVNETSRCDLVVSSLGDYYDNK